MLAAALWQQGWLLLGLTAGGSPQQMQDTLCRTDWTNPNVNCSYASLLKQGMFCWAVWAAFLQTAARQCACLDKPSQDHEKYAKGVSMHADACEI